jgi:hypothetical protein
VGRACTNDGGHDLLTFFLHAFEPLRPPISRSIAFQSIPICPRQPDRTTWSDHFRRDE